MPPISLAISKPKSSAVTGLFLALMGTALFTPIFAAGKLADGTLPVLALVAMRFLGGAGTVIGLVTLKNIKWRDLRSNKVHWHVVRALLGSSGAYCAIHAATVMPVADASAIGLTEGLMIVAFAAILLKETVTWQHWAAGILCAAGAYVVVEGQRQGTSFDPRHLEGAFFAFAGALLMALESLMIKLVARTDRPMTVLVHANVIGAVLYIAPGIWAMQTAEANWSLLAPFIGLGPLAIIAQYCNVLAFQRTDAAILGPVMYSWIIFATLLGILAFGEIPGPESLTGAALIVAGGIWLGLIGQRSTPTE